MANVPTNNWDETKPAGTRDINLGDDDIREFKTQVREIIAVDHKIGDTGSGPDWGFHNFLSMIAQAALTTVAGGGKLAAKTVSGIVELFYRDNNGIETQMTSNGAINVVVPGSTITAEIRGYAGATAPTGWLICNGAAIDRTTYAALFAITGVLYGAGDNVTTFNIPDLRGKVPVGLDATVTDFNVLGKSGGERTHLLTASEAGVGAHSHTYTLGSTSPQSGSDTQCYRLPSSAASTSVASADASTGHNNIQPYQTINYIIKY